MEHLDYKQYREAGPVRDQGLRRQGRHEVRGGLVAHLPECGTRQSELGRHRTARGLLPARAVRHHRKQARLRSAARRGRHAEGERRCRAARRLAREAPGHAGRVLPATDGAVDGEEVRLRCRPVHPRARPLDHRRSLPGARPHAGAQRTDRPRVPEVGDVRRAVPEGPVQDLRGRGRHRRHVLHLQVAEEQSPPEPGRHDRDGRANLHALPGDGPPRGLRPALRADPREAGTQVPVSGCGDRQDARSEDQGVLHRQPRQSVCGGVSARDDCQDREGAREAAGSDPADRRRLWHVRAGLPLADGRVPEEHHRRLFLQQVPSAAPAGAWARSPCTKTTSSTR